MSFRTKPASRTCSQAAMLLQGRRSLSTPLPPARRAQFRYTGTFTPGQTQNLGRDRRIFTSLDKTKAALAIGGYDTAPRQKAAVAGADKARKTMDDLRGTFTEEQMKKETERCLGCGAVVLDEYRCVGCGICTTKCKFDAIKLVWVDEFVSPKVEKIAPHLIAGMAKRGGKIAIKALKDKVDKL